MRLQSKIHERLLSNLLYGGGYINSNGFLLQRRINSTPAGKSSFFAAASNLGGGGHPSWESGALQERRNYDSLAGLLSGFEMPGRIVGFFEAYNCGVFGGFIPQ